MKKIAGLFMTWVLTMAATAVTASPLPPVTGTIASNRLGMEQVDFLKSACRTEAWLNHVTPGDGTSQHMTSSYGLNETLQGQKFTRSLVKALLSDKTYSSTLDFCDAYGNRGNFLPTFTFRIYNTALPQPFVVVNVDPHTQELCVTAPWAKQEHHPTELYAHYTLTAPQLVDLIKEAFPEDKSTQALKAWPDFVRPIPFGISPDVRQKISELRPGMTRADVLNRFGTEGGLSSRFQHTYVWKGASVGGQFIKVDVNFVPKGVHLHWINGEGIVVNPEELYHNISPVEADNDVIVKVSRPYLAGMVLD